MTDTPTPTPLTIPDDINALLDEAYANGHDYRPDLQRSTLQLVASDGNVIREVHWVQLGAWARNLLRHVMGAAPVTVQSHGQ